MDYPTIYLTGITIIIVGGFVAYGVMCDTSPTLDDTLFMMVIMLGIAAFWPFAIGLIAAYGVARGIILIGMLLRKRWESL